VAWADDEWDYTVSNGTVTINYYKGTLPTDGILVIPSTITPEGETDAVSVVGLDGKFSANTSKSIRTSLTGIVLPSTITSIGLGAFYGLTSLTSLYIGDANTTTGTFSSNYQLKDGILFNAGGDKLIYWPAAKTYDATELSSVTMLGGMAFESCTTLPKNFTIPDAWTSIDDGERNTTTSKMYGAFSNSNIVTLTLGDNSQITRIPNFCFYNCVALTNVTLKDNLQQMGDYAFGYCKALTAVNMPSNITSIGAYAFYHTDVLSQKITFPSSLTSLGESAYYYSGITSVDFSKTSLTNVPENCFADSKITSITWASSITEIMPTAFADCIVLGDVNIPGTVTHIYKQAFSGHARGVTLNEGLKYIGVEAFNANKLKTITIPTTVTEIDCGAFRDNKLTTFNVPKNVSYIGCNVLTTLYGQLQTITVDAANQYFTVVDNVMYDKGFTTLYFFAESDNQARKVNFQVPATVTTLRGGAFCGSSLKHITLPTNLTVIEDGAFAYSGLNSITIPANVKTLGHYLDDSSICGLSTSNNYIGIFSKVKSLAELFVLNKEKPTAPNYKVIYGSNNSKLPCNIYVKSTCSADAKTFWGNVTQKAVTGDVPLTISDSGIKSIGRDFDVDLSGTGLTAYMATGATKADGQNGTLTMTEISTTGSSTHDAGKYIPSRIGTSEADDNGLTYDEFVGAVIKGDAGTYTYKIGTDEEATASNESSNLLVSVPDDTNMPAQEVENGNTYYNFGLFSGIFKWLENDNEYMPYNHSYLHLNMTGLGVSGAKSFTMVFDDTTDGIENVSLKDNTKNADVWYNLQGERLNGKPSVAGIYVVNGKKVIVR
jgi:hypothetical protein